MSERESYLDRLYVATPCSADWDAMTGDDRVRFCAHCKLHVYNLSLMTRPQAEALIAGAEVRLCTKFYRRTDGSILTQDCPVGLRAVRRRVSQYARVALSAVLGIATAGALRLPAHAQDSQSCKHQLRVKRNKSESRGVVAGTLYDETEAVIPGAKVTLVDETTRESREVQTSEEGSFKFVGVKGGKYTLVAEATGFHIFRRKQIEVEDNESLDLGVTLHVGSVGGAALLPKKASGTEAA